MKLYYITIRPLSSFGTPMKGDTLFGQFCWQISYMPSLVEGGLEKVLSQYPDRPFAVFSSAYPSLRGPQVRFVFKRPDLPLAWLFQSGEKERKARYMALKECKGLRWMVLEETLALDLDEVQFLGDQQILSEMQGKEWTQSHHKAGGQEGPGFFTWSLQPHNTINRLTQTTGTGAFAPYVKENIHFLPGMDLAIFVLLDTQLTDIERIVHGLESMGRFGFGRDASIGLGRFTIGEAQELSLPSLSDANACYTLAPCVPGPYARGYYTPFVRYGKHGDLLATARNPFKNPALMADDGAVFFPSEQDAFERPYFGRAITGISKAQGKALAQGFSPYLPLKVEH